MRIQPESQSQIRRIFAEFKDGSWLQNARRRSQRRKSTWNLLLPLFALPLWLGSAYLFIALAVFVRNILHPGHLGPPLAHTSGIAVGLMVFPPLVSSIFPALVITNFLVYLVPPARRAMDKEDRKFPGTDYNSAQLALLKVGSVAVVGAALLALAGAAVG